MSCSIIEVDRKSLLSDEKLRPALASLTSNHECPWSNIGKTDDLFLFTNSTLRAFFFGLLAMANSLHKT